LREQVNTGAMEEETKQLSKALRGMDKRVRELPVYKVLEQQVKNFSLRAVRRRSLLRSCVIT
jgi:hypothetical protein